MTTASQTQKPGFLARLFGRGDEEPPLDALYATVVAEARAPNWYRDFAVADSIDGRFDALTLVLSLVLLHLERIDARVEVVRLTEAFIADMDGQVREIGFGDLVVGKQVGGIMSVLGGRLGVYRAGLTAEALGRLLWRGKVPGATVVAETLAYAEGLAARIAATPREVLVAGRIA